MKRVTIDIDDDFATALSITAAGADRGMLRMTNVMVAPNKVNYVRIDDTGEFWKEWRKDEYGVD